MEDLVYTPARACGKTQQQLVMLSLGELAAIVNDESQPNTERAKAASALNVKIREVGGAMWLSYDRREIKGIYQALKFDTSQHVFRGNSSAERHP
jgi:uncharacterized membrane protein